jgi:hypothetical protein
MSWRHAFVEHVGPGGFTGATLGDWRLLHVAMQCQ